MKLYSGIALFGRVAVPHKRVSHETASPSFSSEASAKRFLNQNPVSDLDTSSETIAKMYFDDVLSYEIRII